jgi:hypothetical protein
LSCINGDDGDNDNCGLNEEGDPTPITDGPGAIQASGGGTAGLTVNGSNAVIYLPPQEVFTSPVVPAPNQCPAPTYDSTTFTETAFVSLTVSAQDNSGNTATSQPLCIQVNYKFQ